MLYGWRIAKPKYSKTHAQMFDGEGAFRYGGRWNSKGTRVVYLGTSPAQASMELLVHLGRADVLNHYCVCRTGFDESLLKHISLNDLPDDWAHATMAASVQATGDQWVLEASSLLLEVPSVAVPGGYNYLLNPAHPDMNKLQLGDITAYQFDPRLLQEP